MQNTEGGRLSVIDEQSGIGKHNNSSLLELSEGQISNIDDDDDKDIDLNDLDKLLADRKTKIYSGHENYEFSKNEERIDVYIKNSLLKFDMHRSLKIFEQEFFEHLSKKEIDLTLIPNVPHVYITSEQFQEKIGSMQKDLDDAKIYAERANSLFLRLRGAKENEKRKHRRVQQEKKLLLKDIERLRKVYESDSVIYKELHKKYWDVTNDTLLLETEQDRLKTKVDTLNEQYEQLKKTLEDSKKQKKQLKDINNVKKDALDPKEKIQWTPFPTEYQPNMDYMKLESPNMNMQQDKMFPGHLAAVTSVDFHTKRQIIGTTSDDKTIKLWRYKNGELLMHIEGHKDWVSSLSFHPEGAHMISCGGDSTIRVWDILQQKCIHTITDHSQPVWKVKYHETGDFFLSCSMDHTVRLYDAANNKVRMSYRAHVDSVNSINFLHSNPNLFLSGSADKTVSLWDIRSNLCVQTFYGHNNAVNGAVANMEGTRIGSCDSDGIVKLWDLRAVREMGSADVETKQPANCLCFDKTGTYLTVGYEDTLIRVYNYDNENLKKTTMYKGHDGPILDLTYDLKNQSLVSCSADKSFRIWK